MLAGIALVLSGCGARADSAQGDFDPGPTPAAYAAGERAYNGNCQRCHGKNGTGTEEGPPLVHPVYEPNHHADAAFRRAVSLGVVPHHWNHGPMPPIAGVRDAEVDEIINYVRWLQRQGGIY